VKGDIYVVNVCKYNVLSQLAARRSSSGCILDRMLCSTIAANKGEAGHPCANPSSTGMTLYVPFYILTQVSSAPSYMRSAKGSKEGKCALVRWR
jgi:hypothetical protein